MPERPRDTSNIDYQAPRTNRLTQNKRSISPLGMDTEAFTNGKCFMICTSLGDIFTPDQFPAQLFTRKYRGAKFVTYNLKYDESALVQNLPPSNLKELREHGKTENNGYFWRSIPRKMLSVRKGKNTITIYDLWGFFEMRLESAAQLFLGEGKLDLDPEKFTRRYVKRHWGEIAEYCIKDSELVARLAAELIQHFESFGIYPQKLYSPAYIGFQYFRTHTNIVHVRRFWNHYRGLLDYAMSAYAGGKFEVTWRGASYFWEYDINSAYPYEIANLVDISSAEVVHKGRYLKGAVYGFLKVEIEVPLELPHPIPILRGNINTFPAGTFTRIITKEEFDYLVQSGVKPRIIDAWWLRVRKKSYPYRKEVIKLYLEKSQAKSENRLIDYQLIKLILNSFYGKMVQLIKQGDKYRAGLSWNPIYAAIITANDRIRMSKMQRDHPDIIAVHTDSVISKAQLPLPLSKRLGEYDLACEGEGVILGSGIYQVNGSSHFRGFQTKQPLNELIKGKRKYLRLPTIRPLTWREVIFHNWDPALINQFTEIPREFDINFDTKRVWLGFWDSADQVWSKEIESVPLLFSDLLGF